MTNITIWVGSDGKILKPLSTTTDNSSPMVSNDGVYYMPILAQAPPPTLGTPMGLLLAITYAS